jgi:hypothetical protein
VIAAFRTTKNIGGKELVRYLSRISRDYNIYCVVVVSGYDNTAERVIGKLFEKLASDSGPFAVVSKMMGEGVKEAEDKFGIDYGIERPVLVITQIHPDDWRHGDPPIKIALGRIRDENEIKDFLFRLMKLLSSGGFGGAKWESRLESIKQIAGNLPVALQLVGLVMLGL